MARRSSLASRPKILLIMTDQQSAFAMSCTGNPDLSTPAVDSLALRGVRFDLAYCTNPLCTPSRSSLMTGRHPHEVGVRFNNEAIGPQFQPVSLGAIFRDAGYESVYGGKWHVPRGAVDESQGFRPIAGFNDNELADAAVAFLSAKGEQRRTGIASATAGNSDGTGSGVSGERVPFLLVASFDNPHNICEWARGEALPWGPVSEAPAEQCPLLPVNFEPSSHEPEAIRQMQRAHPRMYPTADWPADRWRQYRHAYYRLCEKVDAKIGRILNALAQSGLQDETIVIFTSDHGDGMGAHRWNQKSVLYEEVVRIPFIVSGAVVKKPGRVDEKHMVSNGLDLLPTLCDLASIPIPEGCRGASLMPLIANKRSSEWRQEVVVETLWRPADMEPVSGRMLRTMRYKYCVYSRGESREQLFDLSHDSGEMVNLAGDPAHAAALDEHRRRLALWCAQTGDDFPVVMPA